MINKVGDYSVAWLPIVNTQENPEHRECVEKYAIGINCRCENIEGTVNAIELLYSNPALRMLKSK
ncbi:hypothetical protein [Peribacillus butanolivorans]|uniref:hypothetical protein n=1 Tax=Peribacillus butanolivorans TaxID=421767 RepID=UPI003672F73D